jgi:ABC-type sugar transport system substrate-binding protein
MHRKSVWFVALAALMAVLVVGCGSDSDSSSSSSDTSAETSSSGDVDGSVEEVAEGGNGLPSPGGGPEGKNLYFVGVGEANPWTGIHNQTIIDMLEAEGAKVTYLQDPLNPQVQVENLNRAIAAKPEAILLLGLDYNSLVPGLTRATAAGIPVINYGGRPGDASDLITKSIEGHQSELGEMAAENLIEGLESQGLDSGNVMVIKGTAALPQTQDRMVGFKKKLATVPGMKIVAEEDGNYDQATSQRLAQQLFAQYQSKGGIQAAYGMADNQAIGIIQAADEAGLEVGGKKGLIVSGGNCFKVGLESILAGEMWGTASYPPAAVGEFSGEQTIKWLNGEEIPFQSFSTEERITKENAQKFLDENACP